MAKAGNRYIRWEDNVTPRLGLIRPNIASAMESGVYRVVSQAVQTIRRRVETAETATGRLRASGGAPRFKPRPAWFQHRGPGRIESGALLASARWQLDTARGRVSARAGFLNAPRYTALQELGSSGARGVPAMGAYALGHTKATALFQPTMTAAAGQAIAAAQRGSAFKGAI